MVGSIFGKIPKMPDWRLAADEQDKRQSAVQAVQAQIDQQRRYEELCRIQNIYNTQINTHTIARGIEERDRFHDRLKRFGPDPHPAFEEDIVNEILEASNSEYAEVRLAAVRHRLMPLSRVVTMLGDPSESVRKAAEKIVAYHSENNA